MSAIKSDRSLATGIAAIAGLGFLSMAGMSQAATISFSPFNATASGLDITAEVTVTGSQALFEFSNNSVGDSSGSSVARIYFETGFLQAGVSGGAITGGEGTSFSHSYPGPGSVPAGNNIDWAGVYDAIGAVASPKHNGIEVGDTLSYAFAYTGTEASLLDAIMDPTGNARIALHVLDCNGGSSCAAVSAVIPVPAALPLLMTALAGLGFVGRRRD